MNKMKLVELINRLETKLSKIDIEESEDILLTKSILEFILELAHDENRKLGDNIIASDEDIYQLTHNE